LYDLYQGSYRLPFEKILDLKIPEISTNNFTRADLEHSDQKSYAKLVVVSVMTEAQLAINDLPPEKKQFSWQIWVKKKKKKFLKKT
jgi:hypothetical protein